MKILVVDDSITMRRIIKNTLEELGYTEIFEAGDGADALKMVFGKDLLITDWNMPNMNGLALVKAIRAHPLIKTMPILMVTTESAKRDVIEAIQSGVNKYVVKPLKAEILKEKIKQVIKKK